MELFARAVEALSTLLWPLIVIGGIFIFRPALTRLIDSARSRKFIVKIAGQELTMEDVNEQQRSLITDLQGQFVELRKRVDEIVGPSKPTLDEPGASPSPSPASILWVDDNPKNNSYVIDTLQ